MRMKTLEAQRLHDRVAMVTGGAGPNSLGRSISIRFAEEGAKVAVTDINLAGAEAVVDEIRDRGGAAMALACDVRDLDDCEATANRIAGAWGGKIDILVNNAAAFKGSMTHRKPLEELTVEEWDHTHAVNLRGQWFCTRAVLPYMKPFRYGKIINIGSTSFFEGIPGFAHYISSKGGVIGLTRGLGKELGEFGIRVNTIAPGFTLTDAALELMADDPEFLNWRRTSQALQGRNLVPDDLAGPAVFLASEDSDMITCQTVLVDGGGSMW
jgi:3-oxoacyl-[acyl-carrier protein] reductase